MPIILLRLISGTTRRPFEIFSQTLSALILTCSSDSSPVAYKTVPLFFAISFALWSIRVDFPIPGSPEIRMSEPKTIPPPSTLSSSFMPELILSYLSVPTSLSLIGLTAFVFKILFPCKDDLGASLILCSTIVFQEPQ